MDGSASPFFGQESQQINSISIKTATSQLAKIKTHKDFNQYLHRLEFYDKSAKMYAFVGDESDKKEEYALKPNETIIGIFGSSFDQFDQKKLKSLGFYV